MLAIDHPTRVSSLALVATTPGDRDLQPMSQEFVDFASKSVNYVNPRAVEAHIDGLMRLFAGHQDWFDETRMTAIARQDVARTHNMASAANNHYLIEFDGPLSGTIADVNVSTLVIHGDSDPVFALDHAERMCKKILGAELLVLSNTGHEIPSKHLREVIARLGQLSRKNQSRHSVP